MRKIIVCHYIYGINGGGVEKVLKSYFSQECFLDYEIHIITQDIQNTDELNEFKNMGAKVYLVPKRTENFIQNVFLTIKIIKKIKPDILHTHLTDANWIPIFCGLITGVKVRISHSHNVFYTHGVKKIVNMIFHLLGLLTATHYFACSESAGKYLFGKKILENKKLYIIKNAIEIEKFKFNYLKRRLYRTKYGVEEDEILIGCVGRLTKQKNQMFVIEIFTMMRLNGIKAKLLLIGDGELSEEIDSKVSKMKDYVLIIKDTNDVSGYMSSMDVLVSPSLFEGLGIVNIEAQVNGLPVIASDRVPVQTKLTDNIWYLSLDAEKSKWCKQIMRGYKRNGNRENIDINKIVTEGYEIKEASKRLYNIYQEALKENGVGLWQIKT